MATDQTQANWFASVATPFGKDVLLLDSFSGREAMSELFRFDLRMRSANKALDARAIVGKAVTVTLQRPRLRPRYFNGIVTRFVHLGADRGHAYYQAELQPRLWLLTLGRDRVIHQNKTAPEIIKEVLGRYEVAFEARLGAGAYPQRPYCVQYDESPFDFISRLMEEEGIFYFFDGADGKHTLVLADSPAAHPVNTHAARLQCALDEDHAADPDRVQTFEMAHGIVAPGHVLADYDYLTATTSLAATRKPALLPGARHYVYPGKYADAADGDRKAAIRLAAQQADGQVGNGVSGCHGLSAGSRFELAGHPDNALNVQYVLRAVMHDATQERYRNRFEVQPEAVPFRPRLLTPRPQVTGTHTARVVGLAGEEIWTDAHGRVKLKFHWDDGPARDQDSSCWVRVSQTLAGQGWGHWFLPRVGQEVVVSYVDGDPDRPLVTGTVYNKQQTLPVQLPAAQTQSVMRSRSSKRGVAGNEIRMEDKLDAEELYLHAQKDMRVAVEDALATEIGGDESRIVKQGDRRIEVQKGKESHRVKGARSVEVGGDETHANRAAFSQDVAGNYTLKVSGNLVIDVTGSISFKSGSTLTAQAGTTLSTKALTMEHKATATQTVDGGGMLALKGGLVKIN
ncbi:type VI secretion system Vgr family protein [Achromobacter anxifer]|jgi:type VI secretion system secreted protein VgrG|uniref:Actin cross-linking toxin VgrG1 n=1 Tax=Achromobacter anxifer TaxID=1287737 RepID=A0A6S7DPY5_9BURK|nr:type VI secretion system tip protein TssI/VgrG [Achromobacter anxifer]MDF8359960.1 type VI secretion system tip protein TssI/VgrG [Achromobacter anxifer]CAB3872572.1 Actin cross-linking toxin VgrG1 [Achromobacter anxifer]CAB5511568.1 Actin cross-linking toxin VgrG1 [Achromobacter anxifer]